MGGVDELLYIYLLFIDNNETPIIWDIKIKALFLRN